MDSVALAVTSESPQARRNHHRHVGKTTGMRAKLQAGCPNWDTPPVERGPRHVAAAFGIFSLSASPVASWAHRAREACGSGPVHGATWVRMARKLQAPWRIAWCPLLSYASSLLSRVERMTGQGGCFDRAASTDLPRCDTGHCGTEMGTRQATPTRQTTSQSASQSYWLARLRFLLFDLM